MREQLVEREQFGTRTDSEDAILLRELNHRAGNDLSIAISLVRLAVCDRASRPDHLIEQAGARLEASATLHRLLARPFAERTEVGSLLRTVCAAAASAAATKGRLEMYLPDIRVDGPTARRIAMIAAELVANAAKYAVDGGGSLRVSLMVAHGRIDLRVVDDGPGFDPTAAPRGGGLGGGIVADLIAVADGSMQVATGPGGTSVSVSLPMNVGDEAAS